MAGSGLRSTWSSWCSVCARGRSTTRCGSGKRSSSSPLSPLSASSCLLVAPCPTGTSCLPMHEASAGPRDSGAFSEEGTPMLNDPILLNDWHVVAYAPDLKEGRPMAARLLEEDLFLCGPEDKIHAWRATTLHVAT